MGMTGFSDAEMALLSGLDAVAWVTRTRITYKDSFKREAVTRYRRGESPVRIFREAGLDPRIIGNKRIERCIARWKREPPDAGTTRPHAPAADAGREGRPAPMSVVLAQTMRINALEERLRRLGVIQLAVQGLLLEGVARDLRRCDAATVGCVELSAWLNRGIRELERRKRIVDAQITLIGTRHGEYTRYTKYGRNL